MGFAVFVQGFANGEAAPLDAGSVLGALGPLVEDANVYVGDPARGCMFAGVTLEAAEAIARLVVQADAIAFWPNEVLVAVAGREGRESDLPREFARVVVVQTGADVVDAIESS